MTEHLRNTWRDIIHDKKHHVIVKNVDGDPVQHDTTKPRREKFHVGT